jgi:hypothetical protein
VASTLLVKYLKSEVENFQSPSPKNQTTATDEEEETAEKCPVAPKDVYENGKFYWPDNMEDYYKPEWEHYLKCEEKGQELVDKYIDMVTNSPYLDISSLFNIGSTFAEYDPGALPPWDFELRDYAQSDVCWGTVTPEISEDIFRIAFGLKQLDNMAFLPKEPVAGIDTPFLMQPQSFYDDKEQKRFQDALDETNAAGQRVKTNAERFAYQCGTAVYDAAISQYGAQLALAVAKKGGKYGLKGLKWAGKQALGAFPGGRRILANLADRSARWKAGVLAREGRVAKFKAATKANLSQFGKRAKKKSIFRLQLLLGKKTMNKLSSFGKKAKMSLAKIAFIGPLIGPVAMTMLVILQIVAMLAVEMLATNLLQKTCGDSGCCPIGWRPWSRVLPAGDIFGAVTMVGPLLPGIGTILDVFEIVHPFGCTTRDLLRYYVPMMGSTVATCFTAQRIPFDPTFVGIARWLAANAACLGMQAGIFADALENSFRLKKKPRESTRPDGSPMYPDFYDYACLTLSMRDWHKNAPSDATGEKLGKWDCEYGYIPPAGKLSQLSAMGIPYVNGKNPRFLEMCAQFYYDNAFNNPEQDVDAFGNETGLVVFRYIEEFVAIQASSQYTFDCIVNMREVKYEPKTMKLCAERKLYHRDRRFYFRYATDRQLTANSYPRLQERYWGVNDVSVVNDNDWDFVVVACTNKDGTAMGFINNPFDMSEVDLNPDRADTLDYDDMGVYLGYTSTYIQSENGEKTPIILPTYCFDFQDSSTSSSLAWKDNDRKPFRDPVPYAPDIQFCRTRTISWEQCSDFHTVRNFLNDYHKQYPDRHVKEIRNMEPLQAVDSSMIGGNYPVNADVCSYDLMYVNYDASRNFESAQSNLHQNVFYKFEVPTEWGDSNDRRFLTCPFIQSTNINSRLRTDGYLQDRYASYNEYSSGYLVKSHGPPDKVTGRNIPLRTYPYIDAKVILDDKSRCGPSGFEPPRPLPEETVLGNGSCTSNDDTTCKNPQILAAFMNDFNGPSLESTLTSNSKCYVQSTGNGDWYRDASDKKILSIGKVVTPKVENTSGLRYRRCDVEFDMLLTSNADATLVRCNTFFEVEMPDPSKSCSFSYKKGSYGPLGSAVFIQYNTPSLKDTVKSVDSNGIKTTYKPISYVGGFMDSLSRTYNEFITLITGNQSNLDDPLKAMLTRTDVALSKSDQMLSNLYADMTFVDCPPPSSGSNICRDGHILAEMRKAYDLKNYPEEQFGVKKKIMDTIFRVAPSQRGDSTDPAACDAIFSSWEVNYVDLFGLPVGNPTRKLEAARFRFTKTNDGQGKCSYRVLLEGSNGYSDLANGIGSTALRVAGSNLTPARKVMNDPMCKVDCHSPEVMDLVNKSLSTANKVNRFFTSFQAGPMRCQYNVANKGYSNEYNTVINAEFDYLYDTKDCRIVVANSRTYTYDPFDIVKGASNTYTTKAGVKYDYPGILIYSNTAPTQVGILERPMYRPLNRPATYYTP